MKLSSIIKERKVFNMEAAEEVSFSLLTYKKEVSHELKNILSFWNSHTLDFENGGFISHLSDEGVADDSVPKGAVLNARILWTFSAAFRRTAELGYLDLAVRSYKYFTSFFIDKEYGGVFWAVDKSGNPENDRKQVYALAFAIYGLSEYHEITHDIEALKRSKELYQWIEKYCFDQLYDGYIEAVDRTGAPLEDVRLSSKDRNDPKSMNTHLHVLEAYANLYSVWPNDELKHSIEKLLRVFLERIIDAKTSHLHLFFDRQWKPTAKIISFGHDIEASWLLLEAAEAIQNESLIHEVKQIAIKMAEATLRNLQDDGSLFHEKDVETGYIDKHREWWVTAEAMVGFLNAYKITGNNAYLQASLNSWKYAKIHLIDKEEGEWFWAIQDDGSIDKNKVGFWKCPYHNARACMEIMRRCKS